MKKLHLITLWAASLACVILSTTGCGKSTPMLDPKWTPPVAVASSISGLGGWVDLRKCKETIIGINVLQGGSAQGLSLNRDGKSWSQISFPSFPTRYVWGYTTIDPQSVRVLVARCDADSQQQLVTKVLMGTIENTGLREIVETEWITDKATLLGETGPNVRMNFLGKGRQDVGLGPGILNGPEACIPFCLDAAVVIQRDSTHFVIDEGKGPFADGVFHSSDSGKTWQMEKISNLPLGAPGMCRTIGCIYYFANDLYPWLWFSRRSAMGGWEQPRTIAKTFAAVYGRFAVAGEGDTEHVCWMDRRHDKWRFNIDNPSIENDDIYYCHRKDSDSDWSREIRLSKGVVYCYAPTISAEGDNVVVTWAGSQTDDRQHTYMEPNDIYYITSKDGGKTWADPMKVTDGAKDGMTAGMPQVALLNGTIHLLYTQGKSEKSQELSPGLTKFDKQPWPIYYTQRPFPD